MSLGEIQNAEPRLAVLSYNGRKKMKYLFEQITKRCSKIVSSSMVTAAGPRLSWWLLVAHLEAG
jgi:hypothetical protein